MHVVEQLPHCNTLLNPIRITREIDSGQETDATQFFPVIETMHLHCQLEPFFNSVIQLETVQLNPATRFNVFNDQ